MENVPEVDYQSLTCNSIKDILALSELCVKNDQDLTLLDCVPNARANDENRNTRHALRMAVGVWCIFVAMVGVFGNLLTLFALPYAKKKRNILSDNWNTSTMFILNLALVDLVFCVICIPSFSIPFLTQNWKYGNMPCNGNAVDSYICDN